MPVQSAFTFVIIGGAFCAASALIGGLNYLYEGKRQRTIGNDHWRHHLQQRDWALEYVLKEKKEKGI
jgi:NADH-ubiquinone oxidoreductase MWFE subunit